VAGFSCVELGVVLDDLFLGHAAGGTIRTMAIGDGWAWEV
jgi:hypothetical protein